MTLRRQNGAQSFAEVLSELARVREQFRDEMSVTSTLKAHLAGHKQTIAKLEAEIVALRNLAKKKGD